MWCTRWYLPLILLPFPEAPPYFLWLILFSTTLYARPCFYCILLLSALFASSCYWPPIPLESSLTVPWSENVTTYAEALASLLPNLPEDLRPKDVPMLDRCWCDLTSTRAFEQYNVTRWEMNSLLRLKDDLELKTKAREESAESTDGETETPTSAPTNTSSEEEDPDHLDGDEQRPSIWGSLRWFSRRPQLMPNTTLMSLPQVNSSFHPSHHSEDLSAPPGLNATDDADPPRAIGSSEQLPLLRREYDFRSYGFALTIDFGWPMAAS